MIKYINFIHFMNELIQFNNVELKLKDDLIKELDDETKYIQ